MLRFFEPFFVKSETRLNVLRELKFGATALPEESNQLITA